MRSEVADGGSGVDGNRDFHVAIWHATHNQVLLELLGALGSRIDRLAEASLSRPGQPESSIEMHSLLYDAIASGDPDRAEQLMQNYLQVTDAVVDVAVRSASD